jgi:hypothetical protein
MTCVCAPTCVHALDEATRRWPGRSTASDGCCASAAHSTQNPFSDHELGNAYDLTHDPAHGVDCNVLSDQVKTDPRVKYVIWNRRIYNPSIADFWRPYDGDNPHDHHMHVSIESWARNQTGDWFGPAHTDEGDPNIVNEATKTYFDGQFQAISAKQRRARETQLAQGARLRRVLINQGEAEADLADLDADLEIIKQELAEA